METRDIPIDQIKPDPSQPRKHFDEAKIKELAESIKAKGLLEEILARPKDKIFLLVHGERRWRACKSLGRKTIRGKVKALSDQEAFEISLTENIQREDLDLIDEAGAIKQLIDRGLTEKQVGQKLGKTRNYIAKKMLVLRDLGRLDEMIEKGEVNKEEAVKFKDDVRGRTTSPELLRSAIKARKRDWVVEEIIGGSPTVLKARAIAEVKRERESREDTRDTRKAWDEWEKIKKPYLNRYEQKKSEYLARLPEADQALLELIQNELVFLGSHISWQVNDAERLCNKYWKKLYLDIFAPKRQFLRLWHELDFAWWCERRGQSVEGLVEASLLRLTKLVNMDEKERKELFKNFRDEFINLFPDAHIVKITIQDTLTEIPEKVWKKMHRALAHAFHPDKGGDKEMASWVNKLHEGMKALREWK